jgi:hypothetical protein
VTKIEQRWLFLRALAHLTTEANDLGITFCVYTFHRTAEEQAQKLKEGKSQVKYSQHQDWLAVDIFVLRNGEAVWKHVPGDEYSQLGEIWEAFHPLCRWGGRWRTLVDATHFEVSRAP